MKMNRIYERILAVILFLVEQIFDIEPVPQTCAFINSIKFNGIEIQGDLFMAELREGQEFTVTASFKTAAGHDAAYEENSVTWESSDESVATVEVSPENELEAVVKGVDGSNNRSAVITFRADGDPDADQVRDLVATLDVVVTQGEAVVAELTAGTPTDSE